MKNEKCPDLGKMEETNATKINNFCDLFRAYFRQTIFPAAFGLALLYMTVLGFDGVGVLVFSILSQISGTCMAQDRFGLHRAYQARCHSEACLFS